MALLPATCYLISRNYSYCASLNLSQNATENAREVLMFYCLGKKNVKNLRGGCENCIVC